MPQKTALVIRATGAQGRGVVKHLVRTGWNVHAFVSDPSSDRALTLKNYGPGISLYKGALSDPPSIEAAIKGCNAVFLNQMPTRGDDTETREAQAVLDAAKATGVQYIVHSTTLPLNDPDIRTKLDGSVAAPAVFGKGDVEELVRACGIPWTIIRPGYFMTNLVSPLVDLIFPEFREGKFVSCWEPDTILALVDPDDIGAFAVAAFNDPDKFAGRILTCVSELVTVKDVVSQISTATGKDIDVRYLTKEEAAKEAARNPMMEGQKLSKGLHELVDMEEVKGYGIPLTSFKDFLEKNKDALVPNTDGKKVEIRLPSFNE
ncbi:NAD(P)-binding protein [Trematosphaeria pertusa]|uniref:NAD(P)-binding protein n=1 Tax=Trematosphaeria pertusa TaxID=390896 RepID=A0A6A6IA21_9PLEO|nr:NAD(P)-binding protein [Trematosphaeria pertusa]KAF2246373.1 NAD(P)-binding protein [Trematosphaeria pertusa]